ncbi:hypothetical protein AOLI_G00261580 [Acnodon oligacanthus]
MQSAFQRRLATQTERLAADAAEERRRSAVWWGIAERADSGCFTRAVVVLYPAVELSDLTRLIHKGSQSLFLSEAYRTGSSSPSPTCN